MKSNYKRIGDFIGLVDERNSELEVDLLLGLSIDKIFIPSVANTVGTNMRNYKIIRKNQFACSLMQVRRDKKIPVALLKDYDEAIISQAYPVFKISDTNALLPDYLMMWMSRPEFDRESCFYAVGGVRGSLEWEDFCNMELPVPPIEQQQEIVDEYHTVVNRIKLNEELNQKLEETAQAIYKHWFEDFEFPMSKEDAESIGKPDLEGQPYKLNEGKFKYSESFDREIPMNWDTKRIIEYADISAGGDKPKGFSPVKTKKFNIPIYSNGVTDDGLYGFTDKWKYPKESVTVSARGTIGFSVLRKEPFDAIVRLLVLTPKNQNSPIYLLHAIKKLDFDDSGSVQNQLTKPHISEIEILMPDTEILDKYQNIISAYYNLINLKSLESKKLMGLKGILLSRMTRVINEPEFSN